MFSSKVVLRVADGYFGAAPRPEHGDLSRFLRLFLPRAQQGAGQLKYVALTSSSQMDHPVERDINPVERDGNQPQVAGLSASPKSDADQPTPRRQDGISLRVLIADDDPVSCEYLRSLLMDWGYEVTSTNEGREALQILEAEDGPSLAVLDWTMPGLNGTEICQRIRASENLRYIFIILVTGRDQRKDMIEGLGSGADDYITKPIEPLVLRARLDTGSRIIVQRVLRETAARFHSAFECAGVGMALVHTSGQWLQVNRALCDFLGYTREELLGTSFQAVTFPDDLTLDLRARAEMLDGQRETYQTEKRYTHKQGHVLWGLLTVSVVPDADGRRACFVAQIQDISKRKCAEQALREREAQLHLLLDSTAEAIYGIDLQGNCTFSNRACLEILGHTRPEDLLGKNMHQVMHHSRSDGSSYPVEECRIYQAFRRGEATHVDDEVIWRANGTSFPCEYWSYPVWRDARLVGCVVTFVDISERKRAQDALRAAHTESELFINSVPSILIGTDSLGHIKRWNLAATNTFGLTEAEVRGKPLDSCGIKWLVPQIKTEIASWLKREKSSRRDNLPFEKDGNRHFLGLTVSQVSFPDEKSSGLLITGADVTERKSLEEQLHQAQKLEATGQLAAGIAHEINTPTQFVSDNTTFLKDSWLVIESIVRAAQGVQAESPAPPASPQALARLCQCLNDASDLEYLLGEIPRAIDQSLDGLQRVAKIVRAMKEFSHPGSEDKHPLDLNRAIETTVTVARNEWKYVSEVKTDFDTTLPLVPCLAGEFNQVILNLLINAAHAIRDVVGDGSKGKGTITIATKREGEWAEIRVQDSGTGIPEAIRGRIFEPFFTTKEVGKGTGQGLALAHSVIVKKHGGQIWFDSEMGKGTTFFLRLPLTSPEQAK